MKKSKGDKEEKLNKDLKEADLEKEDDDKEEDQVKLGMEIEKEHNDLTNGDPRLVKMIVMAHLKEIPDYYSRLKEMEEDAKEVDEKEKDDIKKEG
jgi:hypothetical protein